MKLGRLGDAVVIDVLPQTQRGKDCITIVNRTVSVAATGCFIVFGKSKESIAVWGRPLRCEIAKQLGAIVDRSISVSIQ